MWIERSSPPRSANTPLGGEPVVREFHTKHTILAVPIHADPLGPSDRHPDRRMRTLLPRASLSVRTRGSNAFSRNRYRGAEVPGARSEQGASAWRRTIIGEVSHLAPPVAGAITAASRTTETASAAHAARLRRVLAKRHALPTINRRACSARRMCHQQAFAGPQHLVGWR